MTRRSDIWRSIGTALDDLGMSASPVALNRLDANRIQQAHRTYTIRFTEDRSATRRARGQARTVEQTIVVDHISTLKIDAPITSYLEALDLSEDVEAALESADRTAGFQMEPASRREFLADDGSHVRSESTWRALYTHHTPTQEA